MVPLRSLTAMPIRFEPKSIPSTRKGLVTTRHQVLLERKPQLEKWLPADLQHFFHRL